MRLYSLADALARHPEITARPVNLSDLDRQFRHHPSTSSRALLIRMGPFIPSTDAFLFDNNFNITTENAADLALMFRNQVIDSVVTEALGKFGQVMSDFSIDLPFGLGSIGLPDFTMQDVLDRIEIKLLADVFGLVLDPIHGTFGRCGGMAFGGYDFYLQGWPVDGFGSVPPTEGDLGDYIFGRLIDSLDLNGTTFLDWLTELYVLPGTNHTADIALIAAAGAIGGPTGALIAAGLEAIGSIFHLGGESSLLEMTKDEWTVIKRHLDEEAAWPIGLIFRDTSSPFDQHQVLAIGYEENGLGKGTLSVWDNKEGAAHRKLKLDFRGSQLKVSNYPKHSISGIFAEGYSPRRPPGSLRPH